MNIKRVVSGLIVALVLGHLAEAFALDMPPEISNVSLGMSIEDLAKNRTEVKWTTISGSKPIEPGKMAIGKFMLIEQFKAGGDFYAASYGVEDGKVTTIQLMGGATAGQEKGSRRKLIKDCVQRWGKKYVRRAPEDSSHPGRAKPTLIWEIDGTEVSLGLPRNPKKDEGKPNYYEIMFRPASAIKKHPWKDKQMSVTEKKDLFKAHDIDE